MWCQDVLNLDLDEPVDAILSTATLQWVTDHDRLWGRLAGTMRPGAMLEIQCGGEGNINGVREVIETVARESALELVGWSPWVFAGPEETEERLHEAGFTAIRCWLEERPTYPGDVAAFVPTSILVAHLARLPKERRERFAAAVVAGVRLPLDYVRLNVSAIRGRLETRSHAGLVWTMPHASLSGRSRIIPHAVASCSRLQVRHCVRLSSLAPRLRSGRGTVLSRALGKLGGCAPIARDSGNSAPQRKISERCRYQMATLPCTPPDTSSKRAYLPGALSSPRQRFTARQAVIACAKRLLRLIWRMVNNDLDYNPQRSRLP